MIDDLIVTLLLLNHNIWILILIASSVVVFPLHITLKLWWQLLNWEHGQRVLYRIEVVVLGFDQVVFAPFGEPFPLLIFDYHLHFLILQIVGLLM